MSKTQDAKTLLKVSLPLMAAFLAQKGMQLTDTIMMGWIGADALAAGALGTSCFVTILLFCNGTLSSVGIFIARAKGAKRSHEIKSNLQHGVALTLLLAIPCMAIIWFIPNFLLAIGEEKQIVEMVKLLLHGLVFGFPGFLLFLLFREFISAFALTRVVMIVALSSMPLTFSFNYLFIYGKFGFPALGIAGIGYAGAIVMWFMFLCLFVYAKTNSILKKHVSIFPSGIDYKKLIDMVYIGLPSGMLLLFEGGMFAAAAALMGYFGVVPLAAHQISLQCASIAYSIPFAIGMATGLQISQAAGEKDLPKIKRFAMISAVIALIIALILAMIFIFAPDYLINIFIKPDEADYANIRLLAIQFLFLAGIFQIFDGMLAICIGILRGLKDTFVPMILSICAYWIIGITSAWYLSQHTSAGAIGIWYGLTLGICSIGILLIIRVIRKISQLNLSNAG